MKKITLSFILLLVLATAGALVWVGASPDFVAPVQQTGQEALAADHPIWGKSIDDLAAWLADQGVIDGTDYTALSDGIASVARNYSGLELYWWDLDSLEEDSDEYKSYLGARDDGAIDLWGSGILMTVTAVRGPFALNISDDYAGDAAKAEQAFRSFCADAGQTEGGASHADSDGVG